MPDTRARLQQFFERAGGAVSFEDFMRFALYDPEIGYYTAQVADVGGRRGDFATAATLDPSLGRAVARWIRSEIDFHGWKGNVRVIEVGGGNGALAGQILKTFGWTGRRRIEYCLVEISNPLRESQRRRLRRFRVRWEESIEEALRSCGGRALIFSNELIDAFPAKWLCWDGDFWKEIWVRFDPVSGLKEEFRELPAELSRDDYSVLSESTWMKGQRVEIQPGARDWVFHIGRGLSEGSILTIDYGGPVEEIYRRRPAGTLRAYHRHERIERGGVYRTVGRQDLTVDVNFTDLQIWGREAGLTTVTLVTQREFLEQWSEGDSPMAGTEAGSAFRVLVQRRPPRRD